MATPFVSLVEDYRPTAAQVEGIYSAYGMNQVEVAKNLKILKEWCNQHPHLPKDCESSKFNVEKTKRRIVKFFILKHSNKEFYDMFGSSSFLPLSESKTLLTALPKLGPLNERIVIVGLSKPLDIDSYNIQHFYQLVIGYVELMVRYYLTTSIRIICDGEGYTFDYIKKLEVSRIYRILDLLINGYGAVIVGVDIINALPSAEFLFNVVKKVLSDKIVKRVRA